MIFVSHMEITPNPNALKYILNQQILPQGICQVDSEDDASEDLTKALFKINGVNSVYYQNNFVTISKDIDIDWIDIENAVRDEINNRIEAVDILPMEVAKLDFGEKAELVEEIDKILDETIRPGLGMDGGGLDIIDFTDDYQLTVFYQGACGSCPSATTGTLIVIQNILQERFDSRITVKSSNSPY